MSASFPLNIGELADRAASKGVKGSSMSWRYRAWL